MGCRWYLIVFFGCLCFYSCSFLSNGKYDDYGRWVPKHPRYRLKDKKGFVFPQQLDPTNIYKLEAIYDSSYGLVYPNDTLKWIGHGFMKEYNKANYYIKFCGNRKLYKIVKPKDGLEYEEALTEKDLTFRIANEYYYYCKNGKDVFIESFVHDDGWGGYIIKQSGNCLSLEIR
ncbi:hypothetical protein [Wenyingzhuangia marina]|uniref:Uncharacterized protein n=1 Tax=Wenyingzhuangia marina TaxID=1195760 RepID=A0A1M5SXQ2_9FLAO|nr:hypothetical protein [Wenyingzhuangia marina]SHH43215.1 hypothetical protein SAMN05444281_0584 [Wenyingzhuangia marina]